MCLLLPSKSWDVALISWLWRKSKTTAKYTICFFGTISSKNVFSISRVLSVKNWFVTFLANSGSFIILLVSESCSIRVGFTGHLRVLADVHVRPFKIGQNFNWFGKIHSKDFADFLLKQGVYSQLIVRNQAWRKRLIIVLLQKLSLNKKLIAYVTHNRRTFLNVSTRTECTWKLHDEKWTCSCNGKPFLFYFLDP